MLCREIDKRNGDILRRQFHKVLALSAHDMLRAMFGQIPPNMRTQK